MKTILVALFLLLSFASIGQNSPTYQYGRHTLTGTVILKDLKHPISGKVIKNAMVFILPKPVKFVLGPNDEEGDDVTTKEVRIYGNLSTDPNVVYKNLIGKKVAITAEYVFAPSGNYPLLVNIIEAFSYKIVK